jgi:hypothetical protein
LNESSLVSYTGAIWVENLYVYKAQQITVNIGKEVNLANYAENVIIYYSAVSNSYEPASKE